MGPAVGVGVPSRVSSGSSREQAPNVPLAGIPSPGVSPFGSRQLGAPPDSGDPVAAPARFRRLGWRRLPTSAVVSGLAVLAIGTGMVTAVLDDNGDGGKSSRPLSVTASLSSGEVRRAAVGEVLGRLNAALEQGDEAAFVAVVDPQAPTGFREHQIGVFRGMRALSAITSFRFGWPGGSWSVAPSTQPGLSPDAFSAAVTVTYQLTGYDRTPVVDVVGLTLTHRDDGHWYLRSDSDIDDRLALGGKFEPWSVGEVAVARSEHAIVIGDPQHKKQNARLAERLDDALTGVHQLWPVSSWNGRVVAYASTYQPFVAAWFGTQAATNRVVDPSGDATFEAKVRVLSAGPVVSDFESFVPAAPRLVVTPYLLSRDDSYTEAVLRHELTHVALALEGSSRPPAWLVEGVAEYTGFRKVRSGSVDGVGALARRGLRKEIWNQLKRGTWKPNLVATDSEFYDGSESGVDNAYTTAWLTCLYIADHYGEVKLQELYAEAARQPSGQGQKQSEAAVLKSALDLDRATLLEGTKAYAYDLRGSFV